MKRSSRHGKDHWEPHDCLDLSKQIGRQFGLPIDVSSKAGGIKAIANALNEGDVARAQIATVLLGIPDRPAFLKGAKSGNEMVKFIRDLHWSGMIKADWDPDEHPRWPAGSPDSQGGQFAPKDAGAGQASSSREGTANAVSTRDPRIQLADAGMSDAVDDPVVQATARAAAQSRTSLPRSQTKPVAGVHDDIWQTFSDDVQSALSQFGRAQIAQSEANLEAANVGVTAIAGGLKAYADYRAKPWIGSNGKPIQLPLITSGDPTIDLAATAAELEQNPNAPLTRPATNADWIDPLLDVASIGTIVAGPVLGAGAEGATAVAETSELAADSEFITPLAKLPPEFDRSLPIGKILPRDDLDPVAFGNYAHDRIGTLLQDAVGSDIQVGLNTAPNEPGVDVIVPERLIKDIGFEYGEIKPLSRTGRSRFNNQVLNVWNLEGRVQPITYDREGNIYYGFPGYDQP